MSAVLEKQSAPVAAHLASDPVRFVAVRADLMPAEILSARRAVVVRTRVLLGLAALAVLLIGVYGLSYWQTESARDDLAAVQRQGIALQSSTSEFAPIVAAQATTASVQSQLQKLMVGDLSWDGMLTTLRSHAPTGVALTQVSGTVTAGAAGAAQGGATAPTGAQVLGQSGVQQVGTITLTGTARDQRTVADYADSLGTVKGLGQAFVSSVATSGSSTTFTVTVPITSAALGGRWAVPSGSATATAGSSSTSSTGGR